MDCQGTREAIDPGRQVRDRGPMKFHGGARVLLTVATPMHIIAPVSVGTDKVVWVRNKIQTIPASAVGSAITIMNGSSHD